MLSPTSQFEDRHKITFLLSEVVELLMRELSTISNRKWEDLPELKKKKAVLASRLRNIDWASGSTGQEPADWLLLKSRISYLEEQTRQKTQGQLEFIGKQILALQEVHQYWRECLNVSFRKSYESIPSQ
jgi:hypothetical protein